MELDLSFLGSARPPLLPCLRDGPALLVGVRVKKPGFLKKPGVFKCVATPQTAYTSNVSRNPNIAKLQAGYLFPEVARRRAAHMAKYPDAQVISLGIGDTTEPIPDVITSAMAKRAHDLSTLEGYSGYGAEQGEKKVRAAVASAFYGSLGIEEGDIFVSDGAKCDIARLQMLFGSDVTMAVQDPSYPTGQYQKDSEKYGKIEYMRCNPENGFFPDLSAVGKTEIIFFCSPNNPTGASATREQLTKLVQFAKDNGSIIVYDSAYAMYISDDSPRSIYEIPGAKECKGGDSGEHSLSLHISEDGNSAVWLCFRGKCGWQGNTMAAANAQSSFGKLNKLMTSGKRELTEKSLGLEPLCNELLAYFAERMITAETLRRNYVMQKTFGNQIVIAFTYRRNGVLTSCKYRDVTKKFWQEADTEKIFYGLDDIKNASDIIIVEGEIDKLAMEEAGLHNCVSVPDGAPPKVSDKGVPSPDKDTKYQYLWNCKEYFEKASRIILATDGDPPGQALSEELARRFGRERCWRVKWPKKNDFDYYKDANEVLMYLGPEKLKETIDNAEIYPIQGLFSFRDYFHEIDAYYDMALGDELGVSTGWRCLDEYYNVVPGELTIVTGVPNSGKSEWIDALLCNLNESVGWKFALCSMENKVREHARKLLEKHIKKPFFDVRYAESFERMSREDLEQGKKWLDNTFQLIRCENDSLPNIKWVLDLAKAAVLRHGVRGLVIDPYNELDHQRLSSMTETEYVSQMLTMVKRFAQHHSCHVWFVAHPRQLHNWIGNAPNLYDISGSAHFINKCDNGIVVHRNRDPEAGPIDRVQICVRKVRNKVAGTIGDTYLTYKRITGEFVEPSEPTF